MAGKKDIVEQALKLIAGGSDDAAKRIASIRRSEPFPADYIEPGSVRYRYDHPDTSSFMEIVTRPKGARSASVIGLEVPEEYRGTGIGKALQERVLQDYPSLMGQVSSKAAAVNAYKAGRRPLANPNATLEDVFKMIDEDSSVNLATEKNTGGSIRQGYGPGGWVDDIVKMAGKVISGEGEDAAKAGIRAYQGSPHNFAAERLVRFPTGKEEYIVGQPDVLPDVPQGAEVIQDFPLGRMRMDKIGTGEGAQAYGHGLYAAEREGVAKSYRDALTPKNYLLNALEPEITAKYGQDVLDMFHHHGGDPNDLQETINRLKEQNKRDLRDLGLSDVSQVKPQNDWGIEANVVTRADRINRLQGLLASPDVKVNPGHMYEVNINADPDSFLDWDKPLSEQPEAVRSALTSFGVIKNIDKMKSRAEMLRQAGQNDAANEVEASLSHYEKMLSQTGDELHQRMFHEARHELGGEGGSGAYKAQVAEKLREAGIPGIKYLDAGSRGAGDGTRNYVVFDDKLISIVRKYGIAGASAMLGYNLMEQLDPKQALAASMADQDYQASRPQRSMGGNNSISGALNVARGLNGDR